MRLLDLAKAFQAGKLQKWIYWRLVREKMKILTDCKKFSFGTVPQNV